jgi:hypothetical protein
MVATTSQFTGRQAPCGEVQDGDLFESEDAQGLRTEQRRYKCGCQWLRQEYHDGSVYHRIVHHDGNVIEDQIIGEHGA